MNRVFRMSFAGIVAIGATAAAQAQAAPALAGQPAAAVFPAAGDMAPDFTAAATDSTGKAIPVSLKALHGKVVVLAFYPAIARRVAPRS